MSDNFEKYGDQVSVISSNDKNQILKEEKEAALGMVKVAGFRGMTQDPYPSPFLNLSDTKIPETSQEIFRWCKYFYMFDPLISGAINALSAFPVTEVYLEDAKNKITNKSADGKTKIDDTDESDMLKIYKRVFFKNLNIHKLLIEIGIDYYLYGNCFVFGEMYTNPSTGENEWKHMTRLDPSKMSIDYNPATQEKVYKWDVPASIERIVINKKPRDEYEKIPDMIKEAVKQRKSLKLNPNNVYHFSRATDSLGDNNVWGTPVIANVLKLLMYRNILRQAQEAIAREHIVPMRIYYLQRTNEYSMEANWNQIASDFAGELTKSVRDPNYKVVSPVPVNMISVGGNGRSLLLTPEIQQVQEEILAGMNVPREFIFGGVSYSGSSISLKILENQFITYRVLLKDFMQNFIIKNMAKARKEWVNEKDDDNLVTVKMTDLKMQDDVQQKSLIVQLNGAGKCTNEHMWQVIGIDPDKMKDALEKEALEAVELQSKVNKKTAELQLVEMENQLKLQKKQLEMQYELQQYEVELQKKYQPQDNSPNDMLSTEQGLNSYQETTNESIPTDEQQNNIPMDEQQNNVPTDEQTESDNIADDSSELGVNDIPPEIKRIALQIIKLPKSYREKPISTFPKNIQDAVRAAIQQLETAEDLKRKMAIDMRPMPEKLPPRRDSLK